MEPKCRPQASRDTPRSLQGTHFSPVWDPPGTDFRAFEGSCSQLARVPPSYRKHCSKSLVKKSFETAAGQACKMTLAQWPVWGAPAPLEIRPLSRSGSLGAVSEARCIFRKHCDKHSFENPASTVGRLPKSPLPLGPPCCRRPMVFLPLGVLKKRFKIQLAFVSPWEAVLGCQKGPKIEPARPPRSPWGQVHRQEALGSDFGILWVSQRTPKGCVKLAEL